MSETFKMQSLRRRHKDEFECQACRKHELEQIGESGQKLHVHHMRPRDEFGEGEYAHGLDNLITLCAKCHMVIERNESYTVAGQARRHNRLGTWRED